MIQNKSFKDANQAREEIDSERLRSEAAASVLAKKTKAMQEQVPLNIYIYKRQLYRPFHLQSGRFIEILTRLLF